MRCYGLKKRPRRAIKRNHETEPATKAENRADAQESPLAIHSNNTRLASKNNPERFAATSGESISQLPVRTVYMFTAIGVILIGIFIISSIVEYLKKTT